MLVSQLGALVLFRTYQDVWRYAGLHDLVNLVKATQLGTVPQCLHSFFLEPFANYSSALFAVQWLLLTALLAASRLSFRAIGELLIRHRHDAVCTLLYGAGAAGVVLLRKSRTNRGLEWHVVGFMDDDPHKND